MPAIPADLGVRGTINAARDLIVYREVWLNLAKIARYRPFDQAKSDAEQPIRVVETSDGAKVIMQGNHRVYGAQLDRLTAIGAYRYTPEQWLALTGMSYTPGGTDRPTIG